MSESISIKIVNGKAELYTPYNMDFVSRIKKMGGKWNPAEKCWTIDARAVEDVRSVMRDVYGMDDSPVGETVDVEVTFLKQCIGDCEPIMLFGRAIASAFGRDTGAKVGEGVVFTEKGPDSGGSVKNWRTIIPAGSVCKVFGIPKAALEKEPDNPAIAVTVLNGNVDKASLLAEKEKLLARIAEIDALLAQTE